MLSLFLNKAFAEVINTNLPGPYSVSSTGPVGAIGNIYLFALGAAGFIAFGAITYAGIKWMLSKGNPSEISDAKDQITQALLGLVLLFGAYIILNTINPELTVLQIPGLSELPKATSTFGIPLCQGQQTGPCSFDWQECKKNAQDEYQCQASANVTFVCTCPSGNNVSGCRSEGKAGKILFCIKPGSIDGSGLTGGQRCTPLCNTRTGNDVNGIPWNNPCTVLKMEPSGCAGLIQQ